MISSVAEQCTAIDLLVAAVIIADVALVGPDRFARRWSLPRFLLHRTAAA